jgi:hypothetical protein
MDSCFPVVYGVNPRLFSSIALIRSLTLTSDSLQLLARTLGFSAQAIRTMNSFAFLWCCLVLGLSDVQLLREVNDLVVGKLPNFTASGLLRLPLRGLHSLRPSPPASMLRDCFRLSSNPYTQGLTSDSLRLLPLASMLHGCSSQLSWDN